MSKFRKIIAGIMMVILILSMPTACSKTPDEKPDANPTESEAESTVPEGEPIHPEGTVVPPDSEDDEHEDEIVEFPSEDDNTILGVVRIFNSKGTLSFTTDSKDLGGINDTFVIADEKLEQLGHNFVVYKAEKMEDGSYALHLSDDFKKHNTLTINVSEIQDYEATMSVNTEEGSIGVSNHFTTQFNIKIENEYAKFHDCLTEFAYESIMAKTDNRNYNCVQIYGQLEEMGDLEIYYDGVKYIAKSDQYIHGLRVAVYNEATGTDGYLTISEVYGREFEIIIEEDGSVIFNRTLF